MERGVINNLMQRMDPDNKANVILYQCMGIDGRSIAWSGPGPVGPHMFRICSRDFNNIRREIWHKKEQLI